MLPNPSRLTFTVAPLLRKISAKAKLPKLKPDGVNETVPAVATLAKFTEPSKAFKLPPSKLISPPIKFRLCSDEMFRFAPFTAISLGLSRKFKPIGALIVKTGAFVLSAANSTPSGNKILLEVVP